jgi:TatD DNase family protein
MQDAHLHLQDLRFQNVEMIIAEMILTGVQRCVVNGTSPEDWDRVSALAAEYPTFIIPSYGLHPWKIPCEHDWKPLLVDYLEKAQIPCIGECGLDLWIKDYDAAAQQDAFVYQLDLACQMNAPITIHILKAWGWFMDILRERKSNQATTGKFFPARGFLLHSFNGSAELIPELVEAGAYFSFSGC